MLKATVKVKGGRKLQRALDKLSKVAGQPTQVKVGVPVGAVPYPDGTPLVLVAAVNEFGSTDGRVPERSYLRSTVTMEQPTFKKFWRKQIAKDLLEGNITAAAALELLGQLAEGKIKKRIVEISEPPNAPSTVSEKGSSNPLIDTGHLRQSIRYEVDSSANPNG